MSSLQPMQDSLDPNVRNVGDRMSEFLADMRNKMSEKKPQVKQEGGGVFEKLKNRLVSGGSGGGKSDWRHKVNQRQKLFGL